VALAHLGEMYEKYRAYRRRDADDPQDEGVYLYRPETPFDTLDRNGSTCAMMRNPLMMRLIMAAFHRRTLPGALCYDQAMALYLDQVVTEKDNPEGAFPERKAFLRTLIRELDAVGNDSIPRERLYEVALLQKALQNPQKDSAYVQLLDLGVLLEEWDDDRCLVRFAFDRLFEFMLAEHHDPYVDGPRNILELAHRALNFKNLKGALEVILLRACRDGRDILVVESLDLCDAGADGRLPPEADVIADAVRNLLENLARAKDETFGRLLQLLPEVPGETDVRMLLSLFDRLFLLGEVDAADAVAATVVTEAEDVGDAKLIASAMLRKGTRLEQRGDYEAARETLSHARKLAHEVGALEAAYRIDILLGKIWKTQGAVDDAAQLFEQAYQGLRELGVSDALAAVRRQQAIIVGSRGDNNLKESMTREALALAQKEDDAYNETRCLNMLANLAYTRGDRKGAEQLYQAALKMAEKAGHLANIGLILGGQGRFYGTSGDVARQEEYYLKSLAIHEQLDDKGGIAAMLNNLGLLYGRKGDLDKKEAYMLKALAISEQLDDKSRIASMLNNLGIMYGRKGDLDKKEAYYLRSLEISEQLDDKRGIAFILKNLGSHYGARGDIEKQETYYLRALETYERLDNKSGIAGCLSSLARLARSRGDLLAAETGYLDVKRRYEELKDKAGISGVLTSLGNIHMQFGRLDEAEDHYRRALAIDEELDSKPAIASMKLRLARVAIERGDLTTAESSAGEAVASYDQLDNKSGIGSATATIGICHWLAGRLDEAASAFAVLLQIRDEMHSVAGTAYALWLTSALALDRGEKDGIAEHAKRLGDIAQTLGFPKYLALHSTLLVRLAVRDGDSVAVSEALSSMEVDWSAISGIPNIEDSAATAWLEAAAFFATEANSELCQALAEKALSSVGDRPYHRRAELRALLDEASGNNERATSKPKPTQSDRSSPKRAKISAKKKAAEATARKRRRKAERERQ
jgi:tetratricopeptide (TPR) repeat protein